MTDQCESAKDEPGHGRRKPVGVVGRRQDEQPGAPAVDTTSSFCRAGSVEMKAGLKALSTPVTRVAAN
jgi:hypothetical protein